MMVMDYANKGNLRGNLGKVIGNNWKQKLYMLHKIISGLNEIHRKNLIHCDFHDGNILNHNDNAYDEVNTVDKIYISDLGLAHDLQLSLSICKGERPKVVENTPQCYIDLMKKCWNDDPLKRPTALEVKVIIGSWIFHPYGDEINEELKSHIMEFINAPIGHNNLAIAEPHPQACYASRLLDFTSEKVNEILESECLDCMVNDMESLDM
ncbi:kinase-like domain-containing protein [Rhizophagus irregularis DAOM 181602=DAOM 197198]|nr:kinase-like domain-containing protein [Rhizophagus irregularis DAOM 181602=DAOM 197198]